MHIPYSIRLKGFHPQVLIYALLFNFLNINQMNHQLCPTLSHRMLREKSVKLDSLSSLKAELETMDHLEFLTLSSCCIYRVPQRLRRWNEEAYSPIKVSIGPYHHGNKRLKSMEEVKLLFLHKFLKRNPEKLFDDFAHVLRVEEDKIRSCYSETIPMESNEFVRMILTDACFIIEYFLVRLGEDCWHSKPWIIDYELRTDLILLENQLPFFVLKVLFDLTFPNGYKDGLSFEFVTFSYIHKKFMNNMVPNEKLQKKFTFSYFVQHHLPKHSDGTPQVHHLCDMLRIFYVRLDQLPREQNDKKMKPVHSASKLHNAGIKFEVNEDEISLLKLQYLKGVLKIPKIIVTDNTEIQLRNVVAFEQCHFPLSFSRSMTDYIFLLEFLIRTAKDVEMLVEKGIILNIIGENDAVASITKRLARQTCLTKYFNNDYVSLFEELNKFCDSSYHRYKSIFKEQYWSTPWRIASFLGAIMLLLLTLIQTISSVIALFQK